MQFYKIDQSAALPDIPHAHFGAGEGAPNVPAGSGQGSVWQPLSGDRELSHLLVRLRQFPEIRGSVVRNAGQLIAHGEYRTRSAVEETAAKLLSKDAVPLSPLVG